MNKNYLIHYGVKGMKWGVRRYQNYDGSYISNSPRAMYARYKNRNVDKGFRDWKRNDELKKKAIELGTQRNEHKLAYEKKPSDKNLKKSYKESDKQYKRALRSNTTWRKGDIKQKVGSGMSRKYLSEAKKIQKQLSLDPHNKTLKKEYKRNMNKYNVERDKARRAPTIARNRSYKKATIKRGMSMTVKTAVTGAAVVGGANVANKILEKSGKSFRFDKQDYYRVVNMGKKIFKYI